MYYIVDNYDSFVYNLSAYMIENGQEVLVRRADDVSFLEMNSLNLEGIVISPGPKRPEDAYISQEIIKKYQGKIPILGVCLGHQCIGYNYGAIVKKGNLPMHGKTAKIKHDGKDLFQDIPDLFRVTRYHSLIVDQKDLPEELIVTAETSDGVVMGIKHAKYPIYGVQFHPEAVLTEYGHELLQNFHRICMNWASSVG